VAQTIVVCRLRTVLELGRPRKTMACPTANLLYSYFLDAAPAHFRQITAVVRSAPRARIAASRCWFTTGAPELCALGNSREQESLGDSLQAGGFLMGRHRIGMIPEGQAVSGYHDYGAWEAAGWQMGKQNTHR
jgi:hypothetical protein